MLEKNFDGINETKKTFDERETGWMKPKERKELFDRGIRCKTRKGWEKLHGKAEREKYVD